MSRLSEMTLTAAKAIPVDRRVGTKCWIDDVHSELARQQDSRITLDTFKRALISDPDTRMLLGRCDLPSYYTPAKIEASDTLFMSGSQCIATYNFVRLPS